MQSESSIRTATFDDLDRISEIEKNSYHPELLFTRDGFEKFLRNRSSEDFLEVATRNGEVLGYIEFSCGKPTSEICTIWDIAVSESKRGRGLGSLLLTHAMRIATARKLSRMSLHVPRNSEPALHLYRKFGFKEVGLLPGYYPEGQDGIVMESDLSAN